MRYHPFGTGPHIDRAGVSTQVRLNPTVSLPPTPNKDELRLLDDDLSRALHVGATAAEWRRLAHSMRAVLRELLG